MTAPCGGPSRDGDGDGERWVDPDAGPANAARMYDYYLGGTANFALDRALADQVVAERPELPAIVRANRAFLGRAVRFVLAAGIRQVLDLGSGIPTVGNVHEIAHQTHPDTRVVYVDHEPVAVAYSRALLQQDTRVRVLQEDLRDHARVLEQAADFLDFTAPVAVLTVACLHFLSPHDDPAGVVAGHRDALAAGSYLVLSHGTADDQPPTAVSGTEL